MILQEKAKSTFVTVSILQRHEQSASIANSFFGREKEISSKVCRKIVILNGK